MDHHRKVLVVAAALCIHQLLAAFIIIFDDVPIASETRAAKNYKSKLAKTIQEYY